MKHDLRSKFDGSMYITRMEYKNIICAICSKSCYQLLDEIINSANRGDFNGMTNEAAIMKTACLTDDEYIIKQIIE